MRADVPMRVDGVCHCGEVAFRAEVSPADVAICHCTDCQILSGSAFRIVVPAIPGTFELLRGTPQRYLKTADSGGQRALAFCARCATPLFGAPARGEGRISIRVGATRQRHELEPRLQKWARSALPFVFRIAEVPSRCRG